MSRITNDNQPPASDPKARALWVALRCANAALGEASPETQLALLRAAGRFAGLPAARRVRFGGAK